MEKAELIEIIQKSKDGDMEAMEKLLLYAHTSVSYQCRKMLKNEQDAEDMTQEILVTVYQKLDSLKEPAAFNPWLKKITATRCINVLTRTHVELQFAEDEEGNSILNTIEEMDEKKIPDKWLDNKETTRMIEEIVNGLPDVQRLCTLMFYYSEMSVKEIAYVLKVSENTIKSRLNYARKAIKERVLDYEKKGVKLYGLSPLPFLFYFLHKRENDEKDPVAAQIMVDEILAQSAFAVAGVVNVAASASTSTTSTAAVGTAAAAGSAATTGASSAGIAAVLGAIPTKIIAGAAAALVLVGGATAAVTLGNSANKEETAPTVLVEEQDGGSWDDDIIFEEPESTSQTEAVEETIPKTEETIPEETKAENNATSNGSQSDTSDSTSSEDKDASQTEPTETTDPTEPSEEETAPSEPTEDELKVHTHTYAVNYTLEPCCAREGYTQYRCTNCDQWYEEYSDKLQHNYSKTVIAPTAYSQGYTKYECITQCSNHIHSNGTYFCHDTYVADYTEKLPADSDTSGCQHSFATTITLEATCYNEGIRESSCVSCGFSYTEVIPVYSEHEWTYTSTYPPDCRYDGYERFVCNHCSEEKRENIISALGHDYTTTIVKPTESARGYTEFTCNRCGATFKDNYTELTDGMVSMHTHSYTSLRVDPSCDSPGLITYTCECGHEYFSELPSIDHTMESKVIKPTGTASGYTEYTCTVCGYSYRYFYTDPTGYSYTPLSGSELNALIANDTTSITFSNQEIPDVETIDVSANKDGSIVAWYEGTDMYVSSIGGGVIYANEDCSNMFIGCSNLTSIDLSNFNTSKVTNMSNMFYSCSGLMELDVSGMDTSKVTDMSRMFYDCSSLTKLDVSSFDTSNVTNMFHMFGSCSSLTDLDISGFDTSNVTDMSYMFYECSNLKELDVLSFGTKNVTDMRYMFYRCSSLTELDVTGFDTSNVTNMSSMFCSCSGLTGVDVSNFDTSNVTDMDNMFYGCSKITALNVSNFNTSNVTDMSYMFDICSSLTELDVTGFDTSNVTNMDGMFNYCLNLTTIYAGDWTAEATAIASSTNMFSRCTKLVGAVAYDSTAVDISMANPTTGYFTGSGQSVYCLHSYTETVTDPTCTDGGYTYHECGRCGDSYISDETEAAGHSYQSAVVDPTETEQGYTEYTCSVCGDSYRDNYTDPVSAATDSEEPHSHTYTSTVTAPTCTEAGFTTHSCGCGESYTSDETEATGHDYQSTVVVPTETEQGYTEYVCSLCGDSYRDNYTDFQEME